MGTSVAIGTQKWIRIYLAPETRSTSSTSSTLFLRSIPHLKKFLILLKRKGKYFLSARSEQLGKVIKEQAQLAGMPYVNHRWLGGMLTNYKTIRGSIKKLKDLEQQELDGTLSRMSKKEALMRTRAKEKLIRSIGGIKEMGGLPDAIFVVDVDHERIACS